MKIRKERGISPNKEAEATEAAFGKSRLLRKWSIICWEAFTTCIPKSVFSELKVWSRTCDMSWQTEEEEIKDTDLVHSGSTCALVFLQGGRPFLPQKQVTEVACLSLVIWAAPCGLNYLFKHRVLKSYLEIINLFKIHMELTSEQWSLFI